MRRGAWLGQWYRQASRPLVLTLALFVCVGGMWSHAYGERIFGDDVLVSGQPVGTRWHATYCSGQHAIGTIGDSVFVVWCGQGPEGAGVYLSRSLDGGAGFEPPVRVNDAGVGGDGGSLAVLDDSDLYVVWCDKRDGDGPGFNIYFSRSADGGETFGSDVRVDDAGDDPSWQTDPAVAVDDSGRIYVVWLDERGNGGSGVYFSRSLDGGATFGASLALPNPDGDAWPQYGPSIAALGEGKVCVSYFDWRHRDNGCPLFVCARHSSDGGQTFSGPVDLDNCGSATMRTSISAVRSSDVYVAWVANEDYCMVSRSCDAGETFGPAVQVNEEPALVEVMMGVWANSLGWVVVAWEDSVNIIGFSESTDRGLTFSPTILLEGPGDRRYPTVAIDEGCEVYLAWTDYRHSSKGDIYFSKGVLDPPAGVAEDVCREDLPRGLLRASPNPFGCETRFELGDSRSVTQLEVYDPRGRLIQRLPVRGGFAWWDGSDEGGVRAAPGVYLVAPCRRHSGYATKVVLWK